MFVRVTPAVAALALAVTLVACTQMATSTVPTVVPDAHQGATFLPAQTAAPTSAASAIAARSPIATASPDTGNVEAPSAPELSIEPAGAQTIRVTLVDPAAKAWRLQVDGTGDRAGDRWVLTVETGDVAPAITTIETRAGVEGQPVQQTGLETANPSGRVCADGLPVCVIAKSVSLPSDGNGTLVLELSKTDAAMALDVAAGTATWAAEPFVLGPWTTTEAFPWQP